MIHVVAFRKAAVAGVAGAVAWEVGLRGLILGGAPVFDIVKALGTLAGSEAWLWWPVGMAVHTLVGIAWALFYAYFFSTRLPSWRPALRGLAFALLPALLAWLIADPQLRLMHMSASQVQLDWSMIRPTLDAGDVGGLVLGHAIFGLVVGALYVRPVGYRVDRVPGRPAKARESRVKGGPRAPGHGFIFATGIECSDPTTQNGSWRRDELDSTGHYRHWQEDFERAREVGVTHLRYGPPLHLVCPERGRFDWGWIDEPMAELEARGPEPIVDLCHFGLPAWLGDFQNADMAPALADYAAAFAARYPWVRFYTPVNEMYVCARLSALEGVWNEQRRDEASFVTACFNLAEASVQMTEAILKARPDAVFVNSESSEFNQACCPDEKVQRAAKFENERRFLPLDLIYAHEVDDVMLGFLREHGREADYRRFLAREVPRRSIIGLDYYEWNERLIDRDGHAQSLGELFGWYVIADRYWQRYRRTLMHTETNRLDASDGPRWLWRQWHNVQLLASDGVPIVGFTWYSLNDQIDWDIGLSKPLGTVDPVGLFDLNRDPRTVGLAYKQLIAMHRDQPGYRDCQALKKVLA